VRDQSSAVDFEIIKNICHIAGLCILVDAAGWLGGDPKQDSGPRTIDQQRHEGAASTRHSEKRQPWEQHRYAHHP
jgi:hypothetical protein